MKRTLLGLFLTVTVVFTLPLYSSAEDKGFTSKDRERLRDVEISIKTLEATIREFKKTVEMQFYQIDKRFEQIDRRFEQVDKRFDQIDKRFEQVDKRFEQIDRRLNFIENLMIAMLGVFGGLCGVFVGLLIWDRRTFKEKAKEEAMKELEEKWRIGDWIEAFREYAKSNPELEKILKKIHLL